MDFKITITIFLIVFMQNSSLKAQNIYNDTHVLLIGKSDKVLNHLSEALSQEGFITTSTNLYNQPKRIAKKYNGLDFEVVAFGRGVNKEDRIWLIEKFKTDNPKIAIVEGLAPIINLLVDQIKLACSQTLTHNITFMHLNDKYEINGLDEDSLIQIKYYHLNWLYISQEKILIESLWKPGFNPISIPAKKGRGFLSIKVNNIVTNIINL